MPSPSFDSQDRFMLPNYTDRPPFSSFLPGIAGPMGIPIWAFYVNRGQAVASFGVESKDAPIMEFQPANRAYQNTATTGFRTFIKIRRPGRSQTCEPFSPWSSADAERKMFIGMNELEIREYNPKTGLKTSVLYFTIPGENYAGLARSVTLTNTGPEPAELEILDGMPALIPYGVNNFLLKELGRTIEAWMEVYNLEEGAPFYRVRASIEDKPQVETYQAGHFALAFVDGGDGVERLQPFVDPQVVFGQNTALSAPDGFYQNGLAGIADARQIVCGKTPCAFFGAEARLEPGESLTVYSLYGHMSDLSALNREHPNWLSTAYIAGRRRAANGLAAELTEVIATQTGHPLFDGYCRQTFLDNVLRGGWPVMLGEPEGQGGAPYHIYSRKHGDPERDYNAFFLAAEFYSQGNGNYRDVNQNRRCDVFFNPSVGAYNIHAFMSLIQADGYNPLVVRGSQFTLPEEQRAGLLALAKSPGPLEGVLSAPFTPGKLLKTITDGDIRLKIESQEFLAQVIDRSEQGFEADFGEGYWTDHWTYNLDLIESCLAIFPERKASLLFEGNGLPFYDSPAHVNPRDLKYSLTPEGPRQLNAVWEAPDKERLIAAREDSPHLMCADHGQGEIYRTNLFTKLVVLSLLKFTTLDPWGMGVEMEAGKPGWYDAMNGLPALFGSTMPETYELKRLLEFLLQAIHERGDFTLDLPVEVYELLGETAAHLDHCHRSDDPNREHIYWDRVAAAREAYREKIRLGFGGAEAAVDAETLAAHLAVFLEKVEAGIRRALALNDGLPPTYFAYQVEAYEEIPAPQDAGESDPETVHFRAKKFTPVVLPLFLEGAVRALKTCSPEAAADLFRRVRASELFDRELKMYKVNASLADLPHHIGRARAFTPGWLENESIWLHMEYKYLLETLKAGLYDEFMEDFRQTLVPFLDPSVYRRSPLENSSFLVSSAHPDESLHGAGFVARLSGSTAEFMSIWNIMMAGEQPFTLQDGELCLTLAPVLPGWLFTESGQITFKFLGCCDITYHNPDRLDTFSGAIRPHKFILHKESGPTEDVQAAVLRAPYAEELRAGRITRMDVYLE